MRRRWTRGILIGVVLVGCGEGSTPVAHEAEDPRGSEGGCHGSGELHPRGTLSLGVAEPQPMAYVEVGSRAVVWDAPDPYCGEPRVWVFQHIDGWVEIAAYVERFGASGYTIQPSDGWVRGEAYRVGVQWFHPHPNMRRCGGQGEPSWTEVRAR